MNIRSFSKFIENNELEPLQLRDATVVVAADNFFYNSYKDSGLQHTFGCESDRYADYLREHLSMFKKANLKCYFVFSGGHENIENFLRPRPLGRVDPIFFRNVYKEVLDEMKFDHVSCEFQSKTEIIALAQRLDCPIISFNIEFCFSGLTYIPKTELKFNERSKTLESRYFNLAKFLKKHTLTAEKVAVFIVLTDEYIFNREIFFDFFNSLKMSKSSISRIPQLLKWFSKRDRDYLLRSILNWIPEEYKDSFHAQEYRARQFIERQETCGLAADSLLNREMARVERTDPLWFLKGVIGGHIAIDYIKLYSSRIFFGSTFLYSNVHQDAMVLSLDIVKYAYDLLTNFQNEGFTFFYDTRVGRDSFVVRDDYSIPKPDYEANVCVFENGWTELRQLGLLEHFLAEKLQGVDLQRLERLPEDARLLVVALLYFSRKKAVDMGPEAVSVLLSYVTLSVIFDKADKNNLPESPFPRKPILDTSTDQSAVSAVDCSIAAAIMAEYCSVSKEMAEEIFDQELLYPLVEFQHCLSQLAALNSLCGAPLKPPAFSRTYNGTLVYRLRHAMKEGSTDRRQFLDELLSPAPTVYAFLNGLIEIYEENL